MSSADSAVAFEPGRARPAGQPSLAGLLGETRAAVIDRILHAGPQTAAELAAHLGISSVAIRRHLNVLEDEHLVQGEIVNRGRGRPAARYRLTDAARRLLPQRSGAVASELLDFISSEHGREGLRTYLKWRMEREAQTLAGTVTSDDLGERLDQLAKALSAAGFDASVEEDGEGFTLVQDHCAIFDVARDHPEMCAYEAATFSRVLGSDVTLSRRETLAAGADACVCCVTPKESAK